MNQHSEKGQQHGSDKKGHPVGLRQGPGANRTTEKQPGNQKSPDDRSRSHGGHNPNDHGDMDDMNHDSGR